MDTLCLTLGEEILLAHETKVFLWRNLQFLR